MLTVAHGVLHLQICPYYGSRRAVPGADVVLAPYHAVLMPDARDSLGIELQDSVLVFDEAHNLLDALNSAHSTTVTGTTQAAPAPSRLQPIDALTWLLRGLT
jgi:Rad3-related DNA helicase